MKSRYSKLIGAVIAGIFGIAIAIGVPADVADGWKQAAVLVLTLVGVYVAPANEPA